MSGRRKPLRGSLAQWSRFGQATGTFVWLVVGYWGASNGLPLIGLAIGYAIFWSFDILLVLPWEERRRRAKARDILAAVGGAR